MDFFLERGDRRHALPEFFRQVPRILTVADDARRQQDDELGPITRIGRRLEKIAQDRDVRQNRDTAVAIALAIADQAAQDDGLSGLDGDRTLDLALLDRRR